MQCQEVRPSSQLSHCQISQSPLRLAVHQGEMMMPQPKIPRSNSCARTMGMERQKFWCADQSVPRFVHYFNQNDPFASTSCAISAFTRYVATGGPCFAENHVSHPWSASARILGPSQVPAEPPPTTTTTICRRKWPFLLACLLARWTDA